MSPDKSNDPKYLHFFVMDNMLSNFYHGDKNQDNEIIVSFKKDYYKVAKVLVVSRGYYSNPKLYGCSYKREKLVSFSE